MKKNALSELEYKRRRVWLVPGLGEVTHHLVLACAAIDELEANQAVVDGIVARVQEARVQVRVHRRVRRERRVDQGATTLDLSP